MIGRHYQCIFIKLLFISYCGREFRRGKKNDRYIISNTIVVVVVVVVSSNISSEDTSIIRFYFTTIEQAGTDLLIV